MPRSYLDSSAAIKLYLPEKGTDTVRELNPFLEMIREYHFS
jgi:predicted nucleic acid-binding protein